MENFTMWVIAMLIVGVVAIEGLPMQSRDKRDEPADPFANLDKNNDDFISKSETENLGIEWKSVADFDLNEHYYTEDSTYEDCTCQGTQRNSFKPQDSGISHTGTLRMSPMKNNAND